MADMNHPPAWIEQVDTDFTETLSQFYLLYAAVSIQRALDALLKCATDIASRVMFSAAWFTDYNWDVSGQSIGQSIPAFWM